MEKAPSKTKHISTFGIGAERAYFIENLSLLLSSGMTIMPALASIKDDLRTGRMKKIVEQMESSIAGGVSLSKTLDASGLFGDHAIALIRVGEESGKLSENLKMVAMQDERDRDFTSKVRSAMMYPALVFGLTMVIGIGIAWFILPKLSTVFDGLNLKLPLITKIVIGLGVFLGNYGIYAVPAFIIVSLVIIFILFFYSKTKGIGQWILRHTPGISKLIKESELARMGTVFGSLLDSGVPVIDALESLRGTTTMHVYQKFYKYLTESIRSGTSFRKSFVGYKSLSKLIPSPIQQMISSAEESGNLSETFTRIGDIYSKKIEITTKDLATLIEPILLVIVWLGVMAIAFAVILPIYGLIGGINPGV